MLVAVGFMRFLLPVIIVAVIGALHFTTALKLAFTNIHQFSSILAQSHYLVAGFGGAFLMLIALRYFIQEKEDGFWIAPVERAFTSLTVFEDGRIAIVALTAMLTAALIPAHGKELLLAAFVGIVCNIIVELLKAATTALNEKIGHRVGAVATGAITGMIALAYLEVIDASFSFDGVIAAFALTNNVLVVAVGLGTGAAFVRSLTLLLVDTGTLSEYRYLEAGAYWAIAGLSISMFVGAIFHVPDYVTAGYGGLVIAAAFIHSLYSNWQDKKLVAASASNSQVDYLKTPAYYSSNYSATKS
jgi:hypothetical protein